MSVFQITKKEQEILEYIGKNGSSWYYRLSTSGIASNKTVLRALDTLERLNLIDESEEDVRGRRRKNYHLTFYGLLNYLFLIVKEERLSELDKIIPQYENFLLSFKKFELFSREGLGEQMLDCIFQGIKATLEASVILWEMGLRGDWLPRGEQQLRKIIDTNILSLPIDARDENFARICKGDQELKQLLQDEFDKQERECERAARLRKWWNDLRTPKGDN